MKLQRASMNLNDIDDHVTAELSVMEQDNCTVDSQPLLHVNNELISVCDEPKDLVNDAQKIQKPAGLHHLNQHNTISGSNIQEKFAYLSVSNKDICLSCFVCGELKGNYTMSRCSYCSNISHDRCGIFVLDKDNYRFFICQICLDAHTKHDGIIILPKLKVIKQKEKVHKADVHVQNSDNLVNVRNVTSLDETTDVQATQVQDVLGDLNATENWMGLTDLEQNKHKLDGQKHIF